MINILLSLLYTKYTYDKMYSLIKNNIKKHQKTYKFQVGKDINKLKINDDYEILHST